MEMLKGGQKKLDKNKDGKLSGADFKMMKGGGKVTPKNMKNGGKVKKGLYANIHAKKKRIAAGSKEKMRKPGSKGAPTNANFKRAAKTAKKK